MTHSFGILQQLPKNVFLKLTMVSGLMLIIFGLQMYGFARHFNPRIDSANQYLNNLIDEVPSDKVVDKTLLELGNLRRASEDDVLDKRITQVYEGFLNEFSENPRGAIENLDRSVSSLSVGSSVLEEAALPALKTDIAHLQKIYTDRYKDLTSQLESPPLYLQPAAALMKQKSFYLQQAKLNHALYLSVIGERGQANIIFDDLKREQQNKEFSSLVYYTHARMLLDAFKAENNFEYYQQSLQNLQHSLRNNPGHGMSKILLEYLLSLPEYEVSSGNASLESSKGGEVIEDSGAEQGVIAPAKKSF